MFKMVTKYILVYKEIKTIKTIFHLYYSLYNQKQNQVSSSYDRLCRPLWQAKDSR